MKIFDKNSIKLYDIQVDDRSVRYRSIMNDDSLSLYFSLPGIVSVPLGSYVDFEGQRYTLFYPENFKKHNTRNFEYTLVLHGNRELLKRFKFKDTAAIPYRLKFPLTAKPVDFVTRIVQNMNLHDSGWTVGTCIDATEKLISFNHESCFDVLGRLAQEFNTEWEIAGKTIHLRKVEKFKADPLALSYGKGNGFKSGTGRMNDGDKIPIGRLYVQGGERNIDYSAYGSASLLLPKSSTLIYEGKTYRTDAEGMSITRDGNSNVGEDSFDGSDNYPKRIGTVSQVVAVDASKNLYDIKDSSIPLALNYRDCRIPGEKATIVFQSGILAGREFDLEQSETDLTGYIHAERSFKIVPQEQDGQVMPGGAFIPAVGDKYAVFNIRMPQAYIRNDADKSGASWDMMRAAVRYFAENENQKFQFTGELDGVWSKSRWLQIGGKIVPGGHVLFSDPQFLPGGEVIRIVSVKDYVNSPHKPEITLSNAPVSGSFASGLAKLEAEEVVIEQNRRDMIRFAQRQWRDTKETQAMLEQSLLNFSGSINPVTIKTMQLIAGDESLQFRFVNSKTTPVRVDHDITFNPSTKVLTVAAGIIQHMTLGITEMSSAGRARTYKFWDISSYPSPALTSAEIPYYLYLKCSKTGTTGTYLLSETAIGMESVSGFYHFLVGILNSEQSGDRSFAPVYGFTEILPGRITTDKIISQDGNTFFDLVNGIIGGKISFTAGSSGLANLSEWDDVAQDIQDAQSSANSAQLAADSAMQTAQSAADGKSTTYLAQPSKYSLGDTWVLGAAWNGFKAGDILTATQSSSTFVAAHWIKRVRYTDDTTANEAKQLAIDTQNNLNSTNETVNALDSEWGIITKDGIISEAEAKAIEKYKNIINTEKVGLEAQYNKLYTNSYLSGTAKSNLLNAKISYFGTVDNLLLAIDTAIADGATTPAEKALVDTRFSQYRTALASFQSAVEDANKAIQDAIKAIADGAATAASDAVAAANISKAITDKFGTTVNGGLVQSVMMLLRALNSQIETAGISGIQGDGTLPAFWSGGTYEEAISGIAKKIDRHDGSGHLAGGNLWWNALGELFFGKAFDSKTIVITPTGNIPTLAEIGNKEKYALPLVNSSIYKDFNNPSHTGTVSDLYVSYTSEFELVNDAILTINTEVAYSWGSGLPQFGADGTIKLQKYNGTTWIDIQYGALSYGNGYYSYTLNIENIHVLSGKYRIHAEFLCGGETPSGANATVTLQKYFDIQYQLKVKKLVVASDGIAFLDSLSDNYFRLSLQDSTPLRYRGGMDIPGVLASGSVGLNGGFNQVWGAKKHASQTAVRNSVGYYTVYHSIGHTDYTVLITPETDQRVCYVASKGVNSFTVYFRNLSGALSDSNFSFLISGRN